MHALELLNPEISPEQVTDFTYGQPQCSNSAFLCLTTVRPERLAWKYRHARAYRLWMYDAGHYGQTFALLCTALGLGPYQTAAFHDSRLEAFIGLDGNTEFAAYVLAAGVPTEGLPGSRMPSDYNYPSPFQLRQGIAGQ